jgi:hydrogenase maturation protease
VHGGDGAGLIDLFEAAPHVILVDAARSGAVAGTLHVFDAKQASLPAHFFHYSTHLFGLAEAVETARALGALPRILWVYGIEGAGFEVGEALSAPVRAGAAALVARLLADDFTNPQRIA